MYADWDHPDKLFSPPKKFSLLYPMEEKWSLPAIDAAISYVNKSLTFPVDNAHVFRDPTEKKLESLFKSSFTMAGAVTQPAAAIGMCQF